MIYVVEGPDRAGKTSFIEVLRKNITNPNTLVIHSSKPPKVDKLEEWTIAYYKQLIETSIDLSRKGYTIILDRSWISEYVYGPLYRNIDINIDIPENAYDEFHIVLLIDSADNLLSREDGQSHVINLEGKNNEINAFTNIVKQSNIYYTICDWSKIEFNSIVLNDIATSIL